MSRDDVQRWKDKYLENTASRSGPASGGGGPPPPAGRGPGA